MARSGPAETLDLRPVPGPGRSGRLHETIVTRTAELAMQGAPAPRRILDVGCGQGALLRAMAAASPTAVALVGVDPSPHKVATARAAAADERLRFDVGTAEELRYADGTFDLVVSATSFTGWGRLDAGMAQCARVLASGGHLVVTGLFGALLAPAAVVGHRAPVGSWRRTERLLAAHGFGSVQWYDVYGPLVRAVTATAHRDG